VSSVHENLLLLLLIQLFTQNKL